MSTMFRIFGMVIEFGNPVVVLLQCPRNAPNNLRFSKNFLGAALARDSTLRKNVSPLQNPAGAYALYINYPDCLRSVYDCLRSQLPF